MSSIYLCIFISFNYANPTWPTIRHLNSLVWSLQNRFLVLSQALTVKFIKKKLELMEHNDYFLDYVHMYRFYFDFLR